MELYIRAASCISPQNTFGTRVSLDEWVPYYDNRLHCQEPDYRAFVDPKMIRRMSRLVRMGVAAASQCLKSARLEQPDAIITGTAYGCLEDTGVFLTRMVEQEESLLTPTAFIQSTHNTVAAQIALQLKCHRYNNNFVHRGHSFEQALLDASLLLKEPEYDQILVGGLDEITQQSYQILHRMGWLKKQVAGPESLYRIQTPGTILGEAACFFVVAKKPFAGDMARVNAMKTFYKPEGREQAAQQIADFMKQQGLKAADIDLVVNGKNGDWVSDQSYLELEESIFKGIPQISFKQFCGEFPTAMAFGCWLAGWILQEKKLPPLLGATSAGTPKTILIYNHYLGLHHSLVLLTAC